MRINIDKHGNMKTSRDMETSGNMEAMGDMKAERENFGTMPGYPLKHVNMKQDTNNDEMLYHLPFKSSYLRDNVRR